MPREAPGAPAFRRARRPAAARLAFQCTPLRLAGGIVLIVAAAVAAWLLALSASSAIALLSATGLAALVLVTARGRHNTARDELIAMRRRFERLEDRAWELSESEERYRTITDAFGDLVVIRDRNDRVVACNQAYAGLFECGIGDVIAGSLLPAMEQHEPYGAGDTETGPDQAAQTSGRPQILLTRNEGRLELVAGSGESRRWYHWLDLPVRDDKTGDAVTLSVARDITSFKRSVELDAEARRQAEEASLAKSRFLAMASHEMRTPLNGIIGMSKLLASTQLTAEQKNYTAALERSGQSLLSLIEGMLDLTTIEAGRFSLRPQRFDLRAVLEDLVELLHEPAREKGLELGLFVDPAVPGIIECDRERLRQILINLLGNAIKFTPSGGVRLDVGEHNDDAGCRLRFAISDTGPGLDPSNSERIFREFERVDDDNTRRSGGVGLGLSISRALADRMGGTISLEETGPSGSIFALHLPLEAEKYEDPSLSPIGCRSLSERTICLDLDKGVEAGCLADIAVAHGARVTWTADRLQNEPLPASRCDCVIVDVARAEAVLANPPENPQSRIIVLLPPDGRAHWEDLSALGADGWLMRPVREASLLAVLSAEAGQACEPVAPAAPSREMPPGQESTADDSAALSADALPDPPRILLAEDNDINALLVTAALSRQGYRVERVRNGGEAVETLREETGAAYDLVLLDMHMPVMDGIEVLVAIRGANLRAPALVLTADDAPQTREAAIAAGASGLLSKPVDPVELATVVAVALAADDGNAREGHGGRARAGA